MNIAPNQNAGNEFLLVVKTYFAEYINKPLLNLGFIVSLAIATSTLLSILVLNDASKQQYQQANSQLKSPVAFYVVPQSGKVISKDDFARLRILGFHQLSAVHVFRKKLINGKAITFRAIDILPIVLISPESYTSKVININQRYADSLNLERRTMAFDNDYVAAFNLNDINDWGNVALLDLSLAWQLFPDIKGYSHLMSAKMSDDERARLEQALPSYLSIQEAWSLEEREGFADALHLNLSALAILGFIVSLFIAFQAANQAWINRGTLAVQLRLLGIELKTIKKVMLCESLCLTLLASVIGVLVAGGLVSTLLPVLGLTLEQLYQLRLSGHFQWHWLYSAWAFGISAVAVITALAKQFKQISSKHIALTARNPQRIFNFNITLLVGAILLLVFAVWPSNSWIMLMLKYGVLLMASVAVLPNVLRYLLSAMARLSYSFRLKFVFKDAKQQVGRRFLPIAAFYLALTSSISAALMVNSFETSFVAYLNQLLSSDVFISYRAEQKQPIAKWLEQHEAVEEYVLFKQTVAKYQQDTLEVHSLMSKRQQESLLLKTESLALANPNNNHCYINEQLAFKHSIKLLQTLEFQQGNRALSCQVVAIYFDYGNQGFAIKIPSYDMQSKPKPKLILSGWQDTGFGVFLNANAELAKQTLINDLQLDEEQVFEPEQIKELALNVFGQTFVLTQAIAFVLLAIACFGLFLSANSLELSRKPDLHILSSLGYSRLELLGHMLLQWVLLACGAIVLSWPVAIVLANALVSLVLPASFGWSMPLVLDVAPFAVSSLIGLVILLPALAIPLYKLNVRASLS